MENLNLNKKIKTHLIRSIISHVHSFALFDQLLVVDFKILTVK